MKTVEEYKEQGDIRTGTPNPSQAKSLQKQAKARMKDVEEQSLDEENAPFRFEDAYEALRESLQSFMTAEGLKPYSHEATLAYGKEEELLTEADVKTADRYRKIRNDITYRAETVEVKETEEAVTFVKEKVKQLEEKFKEKHPGLLKESD